MTRTRIILGAFLVAAPAIALACVLADAPPIVDPKLQRPQIIVDSASPPLDQKLLAPPESVAQLNFAVAVQVDPNQSFQWRVFVDFDPSVAVDAVVKGTDDGGAIGEVQADSGDEIRTLTFPITSSFVDFTRCHTFTLVVAYAFKDGTFSEPVSPPGGDRSTWFYEPVADCTYFDAAPPTYPPEAGTD